MPKYTPTCLVLEQTDQKAFNNALNHLTAEQEAGFLPYKETIVKQRDEANALIASRTEALVGNDKAMMVYGQKHFDGLHDVNEMLNEHYGKPVSKVIAYDNNPDLSYSQSVVEEIANARKTGKASEADLPDYIVAKQAVIGHPEKEEFTINAGQTKEFFPRIPLDLESFPKLKVQEASPHTQLSAPSFSSNAPAHSASPVR